MIVRAAEPRDIPQILSLIRELAEFQGASDAVENTEEALNEALFTDNAKTFAFVVDGDRRGELAAIAIWFITYSTWTGTHGIHLEDLFVRAAYRRRGLGRNLLATLAAECRERGYARLEWDVLGTNEDAIAFYSSLGATFKDEWRTCRLDGDGLRKLGQADRAQE